MDRSGTAKEVYTAEKQLRKNYRQELGSVERMVAGNYYDQLIRRMSQCNGQFCKHSVSELTQHLNRETAWDHLRCYRGVSQTNKIGIHILKMLRGFDMPLKRDERKKKRFEINGLDACYYCLLAWLAIPEGTARKYLYVLE